ncbi:Lysophospholipase L1 [Clostridium cavendishii DSM 21758]|uniref:Lysophospholipase L1 n=1 Tax=Clostridium cavendishii DSM 21758 TaxID=1121302 RepID=A0A1M6KIL1_9CLOT|nr:SGNH/GDSL hydrolase family protein [Clostridium cavendishii]SHJ58798.1 Lysophospholipase L1 [Clostridium cavendishii DSM 21758]
MDTKKEKSAVILCFLLLVALVAVIILGNIKNNKENKNIVVKSEDKKVSLQKEDKKVNEKEKKDLYIKLKNKEDISICIIGDSIANSEGVIKQENNWNEKLKKYIENTYNSKVTIEHIINNGGLSERLDLYNKNKKQYDLILLCSGYNDRNAKIEEFGPKYENFLNNIIERNDKTEIFLVVENSLRKFDKVPNEIKKIKEYYELNLIDLREAFADSPKPYKQLTKDNINPNDDGYDLYSTAIFDKIKLNNKENKKIDYKVKDKLYK